uniref:putative ubiquitin-conjugating enzyme E2 39 n=1 Tax=Erigeron canadensis TaxID=72917 RepID=UPI001CB93CEA|nr:putative ubiquitin-conjugating enzyme E2 39 [Erigeron canadensis]
MDTVISYVKKRVPKFADDPHPLERLTVGWEETKRKYGEGVEVVTSHCPYPCVVDKVLIEAGTKLERNQPVVRVKALVPSTFTSQLDVSESVKLKYKKSLEEKSRVVAYAPPALQQPDWVKTLQEDWRILDQHLPNTIFVRVYEKRMDLLRAAIVGPDGTPYQGGLFFFDFHFPNDYPNSPPLVRYRSGGLGINPNLKMCGEVCLSLFDTTSREEHPDFNPKPFFNSCERMRGLVNGEYPALLYNENTIVKSLVTLAHTMNKPPKFGCLVGDYNRTSLEFKNEVASCIKPLVDAFNKIGANETQEFLNLIQETNVAIDDMDDGVNKKRKV